jgi:streptogramin lyase
LQLDVVPGDATAAHRSQRQNDNTTHRRPPSVPAASFRNFGTLTTAIAQGNPWFGGRGGALLKLDVKTGQIREYWPPVPYVTFYEAMPDKRGEVWAGALHSGRMLRFNPQADHWTQYVLPEPYSHDRRTWIDNSTTPVTVWYVDHNSYLVRVQARE